MAELPAEDLIHTKFESEAIVKANGLVAEADAVIVVSPVYKASYTGVLKTFLDLVPQKGWPAKSCCRSSWAEVSRTCWRLTMR